MAIKPLKETWVKVEKSNIIWIYQIIKVLSIIISFFISLVLCHINPWLFSAKSYEHSGEEIVGRP